PVPLRVREAELVLEGERVENGRFAKPDLIQQAAQIASETCSPIDDVRSSAWYRKRMIKVLVQRSLDTVLHKTSP
ncbi:MAG: xanthine dehydrogenase family protein subunit M, partial [Chloroflexi bacterium]|nr:xanthine dehydrogenase family protein subunit M [Chloroflexota bacterium]